MRHQFSIARFLSYIICLSIAGISSLAKCGQINGWDIIVDYTNKDLISKYTLVFTLETPLDITDKIQIEMPYALHTAITVNKPNELTATLGQLNYQTCSSTGDNTTTDPEQYISSDNQQSVVIYTSTATSTVYQISLNSGLSVGVEYALILKTTVKPTSEGVGIKNFIKIATVSDQGLVNKAIIYDKNDLFSPFSLSANSVDSLAVGYEVTSGNQKDFLAQYEVFIDIMNNINALNGSLYEIEFGSVTASPFKFISKNDGTLPHLCQSVGKKSNAYIVNALPASSYSCVVSDNKISIQVYETLKQNTRLRFSFYVVNPIYAVSTAEKLLIKRLKINSRNVMEKGETAAFLNVQGIQLENKSMKLGWGLDETVRPAPNQLITLFTNAPSGVGTYNSIQFQFSLQKSTPAGLQVQIEFNIGTAANGQALVLQGSIIHNFPETGTNRVECGMKGDGLTRTISCVNVGTMLLKKNYFIGFKIMLINGASIGSDFSSVSIDLVFPDKTTTNIVNLQKTSQQSITLDVNKNFYMTGSASTAISSQVVTNQANAVNNPFSDATNGILGIVPEKVTDTAQKLVFCMQLTPTDITNINDAGPATSQRAGYYMVTNRNIIQFQQSGLAIDQYGNLQVSQVISANTKLAADEYQSTDLGQYSRLRVQTSLAKDIANMFTGGMIFAIRTVFIRQHASLYGDDNSLDFYFFFYDNIQSYTPTFKFAVLYNAYTINTPKPKNLRYSVVNWYGGVTVNNNGANVPTFIRLAGYLSQTDFTDGYQRLVVFFTGLNFYEDEKAGNINYSTQCTSSVGAVPTVCRGFKNDFDQKKIDQNYLHMQRVEVQFPTIVPSGSGAPFELLIPVQTIVDTTQITLFIATMKYHEMIPTTELEQAAMKNYFFQPSTVFRLTGSNNLQDTQQFISFASQQANNIPLSNNFKKSNILRIDSYGMDLSNSYVGQLAPQISISARHTETSTVVGTNTGSSATQENGAGFTFVTDYDFRGTQQNFLWEGGLPSNIRKCLSFSYNQNRDKNWRYGFFCAMETGSTTTVSQVNVTNFQLPYRQGLYLPDSTSFAYSTSAGEIASLLFSKQVIGNPNEITVNLNSASPSIRLGAKNIRIIWTFTTTNPIPDSGYVQILFKDPIKLSGISTSTCQFKTSIPHICTVSQPTGQDKVLLFQLQKSGVDEVVLPAGQIQILHYGNDAPASQTSNNLFLVQTLTVDKVLIDQTQVSLGYPSYLTYNNLSTQKKLILLNGYLEMEYPYMQAETTVRVTFNTDDRRELLQKEFIILDFNSDLMTVNQVSINTQIQCQIERAGAVNHSFSSAEIINSNTEFKVKFQVKNDISYSETDFFTIVCRNIRLPATQITNSPTIALMKSDATTTVQLAATVSVKALLAAAVASTPATLTKTNFNTYGSFSTMEFSFKSDQEVKGTNFFLIRFGIPYLPSLVQDASLQCLIESVVSPCSISNSQTLIVSNVPAKAANSVFKIKVIGIQLPTIALADKNTIYISLVNQIDDGNISLVPISYSFINDQATASQLNNNFFISGIKLDNTNVKQENTLTFNFTLPTGMLIKTHKYKFLISFPTQWKYLLQLLTSKITLRRISTNNFLTLTSAVSTFIDIDLDWTFADNTIDEQFTLVIANIANPQTPLCILPKQWVFHVQDMTVGGALYGRSVSLNNQIPYFKFNFHKTKSVLAWSYPDSNNVFTVNKGPFKTLITLHLESNSRFQYPVRIALKDESLFGLIPMRPFAKPGDSTLSFYIYAKSSTPTSNYVIYFVKTNDNFNNFSTVPICNINLVQQDQSLEFVNLVQPFYVPKNGLSNPLVISFKKQGFVVTQDVDVTVEVLQSATYGIQVKTSTGIFDTKATKTLKASSTNPNVIFQFQAGVSSIVGTQVYIQVTVNVVDPSDNTKNLNTLFGVPSDMLLEVNQISYSGVQFRISSPSLDSIKATSVLYRPYCPQQGTIYYKVEMVNVYNLSTTTAASMTQAQYDALRTEIVSRAESFYNFESTTPLQRQYGFAKSNPNAQYTEIVISNLMSTKKYKISSLCVNNFNQQSINVLEQEITTASNNGIITKIPLTFNSALSLPDKIKLACYLSIFLHIPPTSVYTDDQVTCDTYSSQYDFGNSQGSINSVKQTTRSSLTVYFIPDWKTSEDYVLSIVSAAVQSPTFVFSLKKFVNDYSNYYFSEWDLALPTYSLSTPFTGISTIGSLSKVKSSTTYPIINEEYYIDINQVSNTLNITEIRLSGNGFLFAGLENQLFDLTKQAEYDSFTSYQLLEGQSYLGKPMTYGVQLTLGDSVTDQQFVFNNLEQTDNGDKYELFLAVSEEDPSPFAMKSTLRKTKIINYGVQLISGNIIIYSITLFIGLLILL